MTSNSKLESINCQVITLGEKKKWDFWTGLKSLKSLSIPLLGWLISDWFLDYFLTDSDQTLDWDNIKLEPNSTCCDS